MTKKPNLSKLLFLFLAENTDISTKERNSLIDFVDYGHYNPVYGNAFCRWIEWQDSYLSINKDND